MKHEHLSSRFCSGTLENGYKKRFFVVGVLIAVRLITIVLMFIFFVLQTFVTAI